MKILGEFLWSLGYRYYTDSQGQSYVDSKKNIIAGVSRKLYAYLYPRPSIKKILTLEHLEKNIIAVHELWKQHNANYLTDIIVEEDVLFQLVHPFNLKYSFPEKHTKQFGYCLFLAFAIDHDQSKIHDLFINSDLLPLFTKEKENLENNCYAFITNDEIELSKVVHDLLVSVFNVKEKKVFYLNSIAQGVIKSEN